MPGHEHCAIYYNGYWFECKCMSTRRMAIYSQRNGVYVKSDSHEAYLVKFGKYTCWSGIAMSTSHGQHVITVFTHRICADDRFEVLHFESACHISIGTLYLAVYGNDLPGIQRWGIERFILLGILTTTHDQALLDDVVWRHEYGVQKSLKYRDDVMSYPIAEKLRILVTALSHGSSVIVRIGYEQMCNSETVRVGQYTRSTSERLRSRDN